MQTENKTCKDCANFERCEMWNYSYDPCPEFKDKRKLIYADTVVEKISELILLDDHEKKVLDRFVEKCVAVDAVPVVHGQIEKVKIVPNYIWRYRCSCCHSDAEKWYNYCPNCGAKMDGVADD